MDSKLFYLISITAGMILTLLLALLCCACTYSITCVHTQGTASDVVDETQRADPSTDANLSLTK